MPYCEAELRVRCGQPRRNRLQQSWIAGDDVQSLNAVALDEAGRSADGG
jgi:hypothetical protein